MRSWLAGCAIALCAVACGGVRANSAGDSDGGGQQKPSGPGAGGSGDEGDAGTGGTSGTGGAGGNAADGGTTPTDATPRCEPPPIGAAQVLQCDMTGDASACSPTPADEYGTPCCVEGACAYDFGAGCTLSPFEPPGLEIETPACEAASGEASVFLASPDLLNVAVSAGFLTVILAGAGEDTRLEIYDDATCERVITHDLVARTGLVATSEAVYLDSSVAGQADAILVVPFSGAGPQIVDIGEVASGPVLSTEVIAEDAGSVYVMALVQHGKMQLIEIPCCGESPKAVAELDYSAFGSPARGDGSVVGLGFSYSTAGYHASSLTLLDLSSGDATLLYRSPMRRLGTFDVLAGEAYVASGGILRLDPESCEWEEVVVSSSFVNALESTDTALYWAESYRGFAVSRVFAKPWDQDAAPARVLEVSGFVDWLIVANESLYAVERAREGFMKRVIRVRL